MKSIILFVLLTINVFTVHTKEPETLKIGTKAPDFNLKATDGKLYSLNSFKSSDILVVVFTCNHCPTAQAYEDRIIDLQRKYAAQRVQVVAISPNADKAVRFDELGYSDLNDSYEEMKLRAKHKSFNFPYLYDGEFQKTAIAYGPTTTPHVFVFDKNRILQYEGRIDDDEHIGRAKVFDLQNAIDELLEGKKVSTSQTKTFGCSIKWLDKVEWKLKEVESWKSEEVSLNKIDLDGIRNLITQTDGKYRLINFWATWCGPCVAEFSALTETDKMYRNRDFEMVTITIDDHKVNDKVLAFLKKKYASNTNYIYGSENKYQLIDVVDKQWRGVIPYTILVSPEGKIVHRQNGMIDVLKLRKAIVENIGRYYP